MKTSRYRFAPVLTAALLGLAPAAWAQTPAKLLAYWDFNNASDPAITGDVLHNITGTMLGGAAYSDDAGGHTGQPGDRALDMGNGGAGKFVRVRAIKYGLAMKFFNDAAVGDQMTISFWQKLNQVANSSALWISSPSSGGNARGWNVHTPWSDNTVYFDTAGCCASPSQRTSANITTFPNADPNDPGAFFLEWHHFTFVKNGENKQIYIDGILFVETIGGVAPLPTDMIELVMGCEAGGVNTLQGLLDDFSIWGSALDADQAAALGAGANPISIVQDTDNDGMPNWWEEENGFNPAVNDAAADADADGSTNLAEFQRGTEPGVADSDGDGLKDGAETGTGIYVSATNTGTDPTKTDSDGDGLMDGVETNSGVFVNAANPGTNPNKTDTDGDLYGDGPEANYGGNPVDATKTPKVAGKTNLLVWWNFDDATDPATTTDEVHNVLGEVLNGAVFTGDGGGHTGQPGDLGMDFGLDGLTEHVRVNTGDFMNLAAVDDQVTVVYWQKLAAVANSSSFWGYSPSANNGERGFQSHAPWGDNTFYYDTSGCCNGDQRASANITTFPNVDPNDPGAFFLEWHHFTFVKDGENKQIWIDGTLFLNSSGAAPLFTDFYRFDIGAGNGAPAIRGMMDDFAVYASVLDEARIKSLATGTRPDQIDTLLDTDGDGMPDIWEQGNGLNINVNDAALDPDQDSSTNLQEYGRGTNPQNADTDSDGLKDGVETATGIFVSPTNTGSDPLKADTDLDGLLDGVETGTGVYVSPTNTGSDPNKKDTDNDSFADGLEVTLGSNPVLASSAPATPDGLNLLAFWNFNDDSQASVTLDVLHSIQGDLENGAAFTADGLGHTGGAGDKAMDLGPTSTQQNVHVINGAFVNIAGTLNKLSVSLWIQLYQTAATSAFWFNAPSVGGRAFQAHTPWSDSTIYFDTGGCCDNGEERLAANISTFPPFVDGTFLWTDWHHFVFLKNGDDKQIWIDGELFLQGTGTADLPLDFTDFRIGSDGAAGGSIQGLIDDFAIYASGLTPSQIAQLASGTDPRNVTPSPTIRIAPGAGKVTITFTGILEASDTINGTYTVVPNATSPLDVNTTGSARFFRSRQ